jgi:hypothetical protein
MPRNRVKKLKLPNNIKVYVPKLQKRSYQFVETDNIKKMAKIMRGG